MDEKEKIMTDNLNKSIRARIDGKIIVAVISNDSGFETLSKNPFYKKFFLRHVKAKNDLLGLSFDFAIRINNPGCVVEEGVFEKIRERGCFIYNKAYLYEFAKNINDEYN